MSSSLDYSLQWVRGELEQSLSRVRTLIEHYLEGAADPLTLQQADTELQTVRGTANMIQRYGAAIAAEEMRQTLQDLLHQRVKETDAAFSALLGATVQLSDYIGAIGEHMADSVLFLQPVINELRLARGQTLLSEPDLFVMQMKLVGIGFPANDNHDAARAKDEARKLLPAYQVSLLSWLKNDSQALAGVARIGKIAEQVEAVSVDAALRQLWRTVTAVAEVLLTRALDESLDLKRLMGAAAQQLRLTALEGEGAARAALGDLAWRLLFFAGRAPSNGSRIAALRSQFNLQVYLPSEKQVQLAKAHLHGPNTTLLERVAGELRADFTQVKDEIDLYVRTGGKNENGPDLATTCGHLTRIASTLSALGLPGLQQVVLTQARVLADAHATPGNAPQWMDVAVALLRVEHSLDGALFHQLQRSSGDARSNTELEVAVPHSHDFAEGRAAMLRETMVNQARFKTAVDAYMRGLEMQLPAEAPKWLAEMASALQMLQLDHVAELLKGIEQYVRTPGFAGLRKDRVAAERFADTVALVDYYLEAMERGDLQQAEQMLARLGRNVDALSVALPAASAAEPAHLATMPPPQAPAADVPMQAVDPEIRDIFLEEAAEVRSELSRALPGLKRDAQDKEAVTVIRRAFHTLKGSGRMVGATHIGEFGWTLENMLNRCLDGSIALNSQVVETVVGAVTLLPGLIDGFRDGHAPGPEIAPLLERARNITAGRAAGAEEEPDMAAVFRDDAREKLNAVRRWLAQHPAGHEHYEIDPEVTRAFHTLRGAAHVVQAPAVSTLAGALETYLDSMRRAGLGLPESALPLLADATATLQDWTQSAGTAAAEMQNPDDWLSRIHEMQAHVPDQAVQATADGQLAEIFSSEAADLVQKIEDTASAWERAPENGLAGGEIKMLCHTLQGAALMSQCRPVADLCAAMQRDIVQLQNREATPNAEFFGRLKETVERLYQLLDLYREGSLSEARAREITQLPWQAVPVDAAPPTAATGDAVVPAGMDIVQGEAAIEMPPVDEIVMPEVETVPETEQLPPAAEVPGPEPVEDDSEETELHLIFISEARELLENLDAYCTAWERNTASVETAAEILRVLHTLKGSARMAGFPEVGEIAQMLERRVGEAHYAGTGDVALFSQLHQASDGLYQVLLDLEHGRIPNTVALMAELDATGVAAMPDEETLEPDAVFPQAVAPAEPPDAAGLETDFDPDLAEVFFAEAGELLESLNASLTRWKQQPDSFEPGREMLRALHTLKGGARMAGLQEMGNLAHEVESRIEALEIRGGADETILAGLAGDIDALQAIQDRWSRPLAGAIAAAPKPVHGAAAPAPLPRSPAVAPGKWSPQLFWKPEHDDEALLAMRRETARVPVESLDGMLNQAGEISIYRSRLEAQSATLQTQLNEMEQAITRLREQLRLMNIETEAQIEARGLGHTGTQDRYAGDFDPLEMDRYTRMQELSRAVAESVGDLAALHATMDELGGETDALLQQQGRINTEVQQGLMRTLMVPFSRQVARLQRVVRQVAHENSKLADVHFNGIESELDRNVLERMTAPLEHLLRNAVVHGIETPDARVAVGKSRTGTVTVSLHREGTQLLIELRDDGQGLDLEAIRRIAIKRGLMPADAEVSDDAAAQFIFEPGFSTARTLTQDAGRGVGMDVVASEVRQLGGTLELASERGQGTRFLIRLPLNLAISQALLVSVASEMYAIPLTTIEGIARIPRDSIAAVNGEEGLLYNYGGHDYRIGYLGELVGAQHEISPDSKTVNAILVRIGEGVGAQERRIGVLVDALHGNREVVSKSIGSQISTVVGISGATILPDGRVVLILDVIALALDRERRVLITRVSGGDATGSAVAERKLIMVVDDSITIRRVTERLLLRNGYRVALAKDGLDAMAQLQTENPAAVLLDIEMPRADGFEVAAFIRNSERIRELPIIMITSRSGDKHRERASQIGVNRYLIKPFQEEQLMTEVREVISGAGA
ncbi:MAG TPA: Hpt domain-containing protein [Stenotrophobium sp.]|nr:Hpt domain-containing protein [Stenotrophobium sp.]